MNREGGSRTRERSVEAEGREALGDKELEDEVSG